MQTTVGYIILSTFIPWIFRFLYIWHFLLFFCLFDSPVTRNEFCWRSMRFGFSINMCAAMYQVSLQRFQKNCKRLRITNREGKKTATKYLFFLKENFMLHFRLLWCSSHFDDDLGPQYMSYKLFCPSFNPSSLCTANTRKISNMPIPQTLQKLSFYCNF